MSIVPNQLKTSQEKKLQTNEYRYKNPQQNTSKWNPTIHKKDYTS